MTVAKRTCELLGVPYPLADRPIPVRPALCPFADNGYYALRAVPVAKQMAVAERGYMHVLQTIAGVYLNKMVNNSINLLRYGVCRHGWMASQPMTWPNKGCKVLTSRPEMT